MSNNVTFRRIRKKHVVAQNVTDFPLLANAETGQQGQHPDGASLL
jgi:hypothetical protein